MIVVATKSFSKNISKIRDKKLAHKIEQTIQTLEHANSLSETQHHKKWLAPHAYRIRIGDHRLGFYLINHTIQLTVFANRKEVYKYFHDFFIIHVDLSAWIKKLSAENGVFS